MIITRTPFRISFAGGGSDLASFYRRREGCVLSTSINKYMYVMVHPTFNREETIVKYSKTEIVKNVNELHHEIAREKLIELGLSGVEIVSTSDIPSGTGLSSSSAYSVGLIHALSAFQGKLYSQEKIAEKACELEIEKVGSHIGKQDQYGTAIGGLKFIRFLPNGRVDVERLALSRDVLKALDNNLLLFYTGITHQAGEILRDQTKNITSDDAKFRNLVQMTHFARDMRDSLLEGRLKDFGMLMHESWMLKKKLSNKISNPLIDDSYEKAISSGALGGKLLGAGGGGFLLFYCEKENQNKLREELKDLIELPFNIEFSGSKIIYVGDKTWDRPNAQY